MTTRRKKSNSPPIALEIGLGDWGTKGMVEADIGERRVQIDRGIPSERVVALVDKRRKPWQGVVTQVITPASTRIAAPCPYYQQNCGGCQWQHISYAGQLAAKRRWVDGELKRRGLEAQVQMVHEMIDPWGYRRTAAIALGWEAGFRPRGRKGIVEINNCLISHPALSSLLAELNRLLKAGMLPHYRGKVWLDCTVIGPAAGDPELQVLIQGIEGLTLESHPELPHVARVLSQIPGVSSVAFRHRSGEPRALEGDITGMIEITGRMMYLPAGSFFQTNLEMLSGLLDRLKDALAGERVETAADIYGGVGTFALPLCERVGKMYLVELDARAAGAAKQTAGLWGVDNLHVIANHAERALPALPPLDVAIVDPPRSGLGETTIEALVVNGCPLILYVSCSPISLASDLQAFVDAGYVVRTVELFDFYPQTFHVESLAVLKRCG